MAEETIIANNSGYLRSIHGTYATARSGGTVTASSSSPYSYVEQWLNISNYQLYAAYERFPIPDLSDRRVTAVTLSLYPAPDGEHLFGSPGELECYAYNWGDSLTSADWVPGASVGDMTKLASVAAGSWTAGAYRALTSTEAFKKAVKAASGGALYLYFCTADFRSGTAPSAEDGYGFCSFFATSGVRPRLAITHEASIPLLNHLLLGD